MRESDGGDGIRIKRTSDAIVGGIKDSGTANDAVMLIMHQAGSSQYGEMCTASLISTHVLVTARHCIGNVVSPYVTCGNDMGADFNPADIYVLKGVDPSQSPYAVAQGAQIYHTSGSSLCNNDFAVLRLKQGVMGIQPLRVRINKAPTYGEKFRAIGYGLTNPNDQNSSGVRYYRDNVMINQVSTKEFQGTESICQGDSGGPAISLGGAVFGITSRGADCYMDQNIWTRLDKFKAIIDQAMADAHETYMDEDGTVFGSGGTGGSGGSGGSGGTGGNNQGGSSQGGSNQGGNNQGGSSQGGTGGGSSGCDHCSADQVCVDDLGSQYCTTACDESNGCPEPFECSGGLCFFRKWCDSQTTCPNNWLCTAEGSCTPACTAEDPTCPPGHRCVADGDTYYCARSQSAFQDSGSTGGCSMGSKGGSSGSWLLALGLAAVLASRRRS